MHRLWWFVAVNHSRTENRGVPRFESGSCHLKIPANIGKNRNPGSTAEALFDVGSRVGFDRMIYGFGGHGELEEAAVGLVFENPELLGPGPAYLRL